MLELIFNSDIKMQTAIGFIDDIIYVTQTDEYYITDVWYSFQISIYSNTDVIDIVFSQ